jgi:hypothetical protein
MDRRPALENPPAPLATSLHPPQTHVPPKPANLPSFISRVLFCRHFLSHSLPRITAAHQQAQFYFLLRLLSCGRDINPAGSGLLHLAIFHCSIPPFLALAPLLSLPTEAENPFNPSLANSPFLGLDPVRPRAARAFPTFQRHQTTRHPENVSPLRLKITQKPHLNSRCSHIGGELPFHPRLLKTAANMTKLRFPPADVLLQGSNNGATGTFGISSQRSSGQMTLKDPVAMHLLVETALGDSKGFEVLSYEEVDVLKKEDEILVKRIDGLRRKLALEMTVRDAAKSLQRLYKKTAPGGQDAGNLEAEEGAENDLKQATKKVDQISRELYFAEERSKTVQMGLLRHTAGVLQATYGNGHRPQMDNFNLPGGRPYSPDSIKEFEKQAETVAKEEEEQQQQQQEQQLPKDPNLNDIDGFLDKLRRDDPPKRIPKAEAKRREQQALIGKRLEDLNTFVRDIISQVNPKNVMAGMELPKTSSDPITIDNSIFEQLNFLSRGLDQIKSEQRTIRMSRQIKSPGLAPPTPTTMRLRTELEDSIRENLTLQQEFDDAEDKMAQMLEELNLKLVEVLSSSSPRESLPTVPTADEGPTVQLQFAKERLNTMTRLITVLSEAATRSRNGSASNTDRGAQYDAVLTGLWQIMQASEEDSRDRKREERKQILATKKNGADIDSEDEVSPDEDDGLPEEFSLAAFSTKVQFLISKSAYLKEKQSDLRRRMRQMREMYSQREESADGKSSDGELQKVNDLYATAKEELRDVESRLSQSETRARSLEQQLEEAAAAARQQSSTVLADLQAKLSTVEMRASSLEDDLATATQSRNDAENTAIEAEDKIEKAENELRELEGEVVRLTTELTICKADLDAAFGSRQERAAEQAKAAESEAAAKLEEANKRNEQLVAELESIRNDQASASASASGATERETALKKELAATLSEFEELTRASVEAEKEREDMEQQVDKLRDNVESLEAQLNEERIAIMGMKSATGEGSGVGQSTSAIVLRNEFKKMMRDTRTEHTKALRVSYSAF